MRFLLVAILAVVLSGCATSEYRQGCQDGVGGLKFMLSNPAMSEPDMVEYYCKSVERNREKKESEPHKQ